MDAEDKHFFLKKTGFLLRETDFNLYAFALQPNHFHFLLQRTTICLSTLMQRLLTSYAIYFNRRHERCGHLFQNRYKSLICQDQAYRLELIRYIHLNPVRAGHVSLEELEDYPFTSHSLLLGRRRHAWFDPALALNLFGSNAPEARKSYLHFITEGMDNFECEDAKYGHFDSSQLGRRNEQQPSCAASPISTESLTSSTTSSTTTSTSRGLTATRNNQSPDQIISEICSNFHVSRTQLLGRSRKKNVAYARALLAYRLSVDAGLSGAEICKTLSVTDSAVSKMIRKISAAKKEELKKPHHLDEPLPAIRW